MILKTAIHRSVTGALAVLIAIPPMALARDHRAVYNYTAGPQEFVVPDSVTSVTFDLRGGASGATCYQSMGGIVGGFGGRTIGTLLVTAGEILQINVGGADGVEFGGGGRGYGSSNGAGATDVRQGGTALTDRVLVAGGSGGGVPFHFGRCAGSGGGEVADDGDSGVNPTAPPVFGGAGGRGANQTAGGQGGHAAGAGGFGVGGDGEPPGPDTGGGGGGGGGGWFGGGGGGASRATNGSANHGFGGGGSGYVGPTVINGSTVTSPGGGRFTPPPGPAIAILTYSTPSAPLTILGPELTRDYGVDLPPTYTPTYSGFLNGDTAVETPPTCESFARQWDYTGDYPIVCSGASDPFYDISYVDGFLHIVQAPSVVVAAQLTSTGFRPSAQLLRKDNRQPIAGELITFSVDGRDVCSATTTADGTARCSSVVISLSRMNARFDGNPATYKPSSGSAMPF